MAPGQKVEGSVLTAVGRLELVTEAELPLVFQLQTHNGLPQGAAVLADHTKRGTCTSTNPNMDLASEYMLIDETF